MFLFLVRFIANKLDQNNDDYHKPSILQEVKMNPKKCFYQNVLSTSLFPLPSFANAD